MDRGAWRATIHGVAELHATEHMMDVDLQVNGITQCEGSPDWLLSTSLTFSRFLPVVVSVIPSRCGISPSCGWSPFAWR